MIFVTVGTGHYPFPRLLEEVDRIATAGILADDFVVQHGPTPFASSACECHDFIAFDQMRQFINDARIVVTHGGSTAFLTLAANKVPVIVPRQHRYGELVDDHQLRFAAGIREVAPVLVVVEVSKLQSTLTDYAKLAAALPLAAYRASSGPEQAVTALHTVLKGWFPDA